MRKCRICGCTQNNACRGGCSWVENNLCSSCIGRNIQQNFFYIQRLLGTKEITFGTLIRNKINNELFAINKYGQDKLLDIVLDLGNGKQIITKSDQENLGNPVYIGGLIRYYKSKQIDYNKIINIWPDLDEPIEKQPGAFINFLAEELRKIS